MGQTSFAGPVFGAYGLLAVGHVDSAAAAGDTEILELDVPTDTDWYVVATRGHCATTGNAGSVAIKDDGTTISTITLAAADSASGTLTPTAGESGKLVEAGSAVTFVATVGATTAATDVTIHVYGYIRRKVGVTASF